VLIDKFISRDLVLEAAKQYVFRGQGHPYPRPEAAAFGCITS